WSRPANTSTNGAWSPIRTPPSCRSPCSARSTAGRGRPGWFRERRTKELTMAEELRPGLVGEARAMVDRTNLASSFGPAGIDVYGTPAMIALMENAAVNAVAGLLPSGSASVGTRLDVRHLAATPPGLEVSARAELTEV